MAVVSLCSAAAPAVAQAVEIAHLLAGANAAQKVPIACVHVQVETRVENRGSTWCGDCQAEIRRFQQETRRPGRIAAQEPRLCGSCPRPEAQVTRSLFSQPHMADVATLGDIAASVAWLANCEAWDAAVAPTALLHLDFLCHVPTQVLRPMLDRAIQPAEKGKRAAPTLVRLITSVAERDPAWFGSQQGFVLARLATLPIDLRWACFDDLGQGGVPVWEAAPMLLDYFRSLARTERVVPAEVFLALAGIDAIRAGDRPYRELERPDRVPTVASLALAPHRLPWEGAVDAGASAPSPGTTELAALIQDLQAAESRGDSLEYLRLQTRQAYVLWSAGMQQNPKLHGDPKRLAMSHLTVPLGLAPELRDLWTVAQYEQLLQTARLLPKVMQNGWRRQGQQALAADVQKGALQALCDDLVACCESYSRGERAEGSRRADEIWRWVMQEAAAPRAAGKDTAVAAAQVDRQWDGREFDRALLLPSFALEIANGVRQRGGKSGQVDTKFLESYPLLDVGPLPAQEKAKAKAESMQTIVVALLVEQSVVTQAEASIAALEEQIENLPPDAPRLDAELANRKEAAAQLRRPITNNVARQRYGGCLPEVYPVDLLGTGLPAEAWWNELGKAIVEKARQAAGVRTDLRADAKAEYLALWRVRRCLRWGDFASAQTLLDELWKAHLRR